MIEAVLIFFLLSIVVSFGYVTISQARRINILMQHREQLGDALSEEHRARHGCVGPLWVRYSGYIQHMRGDSDGD